MAISPEQGPKISEGQLMTILPEKNLPGVVVPSDDTAIQIRLRLGDPRLDEAGANVTIRAASNHSIAVGDYVSFSRRARTRRHWDDMPTSELRQCWAHDVIRITEEQADTLAELIRSTYDIGYYNLLTDWHTELATRDDGLDESRTELDGLKKDLLERQRVVAEDQERLADELVAAKEERRSLSARSKEADVRDKRLNAKESRLEDWQHTLEELESEIVPYRRYLPVASSKAKDVAPITDSLPQDLGYTWPSILADHGIALPSDVANAYLLAVMTAAINGRLVLLDGPVGSGKTSIVMASAAAFNATDAVIPVRPGWLDPTDLLGYFDPISRIYRPADLVQFIVDANRDADWLSLAYLDELNLARIENYAADLLSVLEYRSEESSPAKNPPMQKPYSALERTEEPKLDKIATAQELRLYPRPIFDSLFSELRELEARGDRLDSESLLRAGLLRSTLSEYPDHVPIPNNLVLLGTLNSDQTTYELSPKVIDRSFVIPFPAAFAGINDNPATSHEAGAHLSMTAISGAAQLTRELSNDWSSIQALDTHLCQVGIPLSHRVKQDYAVFMALAGAISVPGPNAKALFLLTRVIPRIDFAKGRSSSGVGSAADKRVRACRNLLEQVSRSGESSALSRLVGQLMGQLQDNDCFDVGMWRHQR